MIQGRPMYTILPINISSHESTHTNCTYITCQATQQPSLISLPMFVFLCGTYYAYIYGVPLFSKKSHDVAKKWRLLLWF